MQQKIAQITAGLRHCGYIVDDELATSLALVENLERPLLIEGEAGVGKTSIAAALADMKQTQLIRLQCFEGIDVSTALYEWNYSQQLLNIKLAEQSNRELTELDIYQERFLLERPLLKAIRQPVPPVLLIDEVDRSDEAFEAFLLELLSEFTVTIPEIGTIAAATIPVVILTSNGTRELSDALRRRCLFHYASYPSYCRELAILKMHLPQLAPSLRKQVARFVQVVREWDIGKRPGVAETLDWARALHGFDVESLTRGENTVDLILSCLLKTPEDQRYARELLCGENQNIETLLINRG